MSFFMILRIAVKALNRNKMRTALTMLGMIIGVAAVITMVALGTGAQTSIEAQIQSAGTNMIISSAGTPGGVRASTPQHRKTPRPSRSFRVYIPPARTRAARSSPATRTGTRRPGH
jgi:ABC-type lipoprotein release transport system permease subunit